MAASRRSLYLLEDSFAICRLDKDSAVPDWATSGDFFSVARTPDELCVVCSQASVPAGVECEFEWRCLKVESPFQFDLSGMVTSIAALLAGAGIDLFVVATQDSDYLMVKEHDLEQTVLMLSQAGFRVDR